MDEALRPRAGQLGFQPSSTIIYQRRDGDLAFRRANGDRGGRRLWASHTVSLDGQPVGAVARLAATVVAAPTACDIEQRIARIRQKVLSAAILFN